MTCHKVRLEHQIAGANGHIAKTQVGFCDTAGFLGIIFKIRLCVLVCMVTDDFDGVFVCANGTVRAKAPEFACNRAFISNFRLCADLDGRIGNIVDDANSEMVLFHALHIVKYRNYLRRCYVLGRKAVASSQHLRAASSLYQCRADIFVQRFAQCAGFLRSVQNSDNLRTFRQSLHEMLHGEWTIQMYLQEANLFTLCRQIFHNFLRCACDGAHRNDNMLCIGCAEVVKQVIIAACNFIDFQHVVLNDFRQTCIERRTCFPVLEKYVRVLYSRTLHGTFRIQRALAEFPERVLVNQLANLIIVHNFNFLKLMGSTETVKEMYERHTALDCGQMRNAAQIHNFLHRCGRKHCTANLAAAHNVGMVAEDRECMCADCSGTDMEYAGLQLARNTVHRGNHQQKTLRCCVCSRQRTGLQ